VLFKVNSLPISTDQNAFFEKNLYVVMVGYQVPLSQMLQIWETLVMKIRTRNMFVQIT